MKFMDIIPRIKWELHYKVGRVVDREGNQSWHFTNFKQHRDGDQPAYVGKDGRKEWWRFGVLHRENGQPAIEGVLGHREWLVRGERHRENGPALVSIDGTKEWWVNGKRHREDGPAIERPDGNNEWYRDGKAWAEGPGITPKVAKENKEKMIAQAVQEATVTETPVKPVPRFKIKQPGGPGL